MSENHAFHIWTIKAVNEHSKDYQGNCLSSFDDQREAEDEANLLTDKRPELEAFILPFGRENEFHRKCCVQTVTAESWCKSKLVKNQKFYEFEMVDYLELLEQKTLLQDIDDLENQITPRRWRESLLTDEGAAWLSSINDKIAEIREKLP